MINVMPRYCTNCGADVIYQPTTNLRMDLHFGWISDPCSTCGTIITIEFERDKNTHGHLVHLPEPIK